MKRSWPLHPLLFAVFPVLFLFAHNVNQVELAEFWRPFFIVLVLAAVGWGVLALVMRSWVRSALAATLAIVLFFTLKVIIEYVDKATWAMGGLHLRNRYLVLLLVLGCAFIFYRLLRSRHSFRPLTMLLNSIALVLVVLQIGMIAIGKWEAARAQVDGIEIHPTAAVDTLAHKPNIFYIILDAYARQDVLRDYYDYDNGPFLDSLRARGFVVADSSTTNYCYTYTSLTAALNMRYLDDVLRQIDKPTHAPIQVLRMLRHSRLVDELKQYGYQFASYSTGYAKTEIRNSDIFLGLASAPSELETLLMNMTVLPKLLRKVYPQFFFDTHRHRIHYIFDTLHDLARLEEPVFVLAHVLAPHTPFVFGPNGESVNNRRKWGFMDGDVVVDEWGLDAYVKGYRDQLHYVNGRLLQTVDEILESSAEPPIIILQGDHGPRSHVHASELAKTDVRELFPILNAYYLPHGGAAIIPQDISPVNTFRMILNYYFHYGFDRLPDESYYHPHRDASKFTRVTDRVRTPVAVPDTLVP